MKNEELQSGDLIFWYTSNDLFGEAQRLVGQPVGHVAIVYDVVKDENNKFKVRVVEALEKGLVRNIYDIANMDLAVKRSKKVMDIAKMRTIINNIYTERVNSGMNGYPMDDLADAAANAVLEAITFGLWESHRLAKDNFNMFCSEFIAECYDQYGDKITIECNDTITPTQEYKSDQFYIIRDFIKKG